MSRITVLGGTGYAGGHLVAEAARRGHAVTAWSSRPAAAPVAGATYRTGDLLDPAVAASAVEGADVVVSALSPRGRTEGHLEEVLAVVATAAAKHGVRLGVVGGAGSLLVAPGGTRLMDTDAFPAEILPEANALTRVLEALQASEPGLDWFFVSPAANFGAHAPGTATGSYRVGGDVLLADAEGVSALSGADLATAIVDEVERPAHRRVRFSVAY